MTLIEEYTKARDNVTYYALKYRYCMGDGRHIIVSSEQRLYWLEQANKWERITKLIRLQIINQNG